MMTTPEEFIKENKKSPVIAGRLKSNRDAVYILKNGKSFTLKCGELGKAGYFPVWDI